MKSFICTFAITALTLVGAAPQAEARSSRHSSHVYISGYRSCGTPIYKQRYVVRYDRCGAPVWGYRVVAAPRVYCPPPRPRCYPVPACPPPLPYYGGCRNNGIVIQGAIRF